MGIPEKVSGPISAMHESNRRVLSERATEFETNLVTSCANSMINIPTEVCWNYENQNEILCSW